MTTLSLQIAKEWADGSFVVKPGDEDIHTANERRLKVRTIRSVAQVLWSSLFDVKVNPKYASRNSSSLISVVSGVEMY